MYYFWGVTVKGLINLPAEKIFGVNRKKHPAVIFRSQTGINYRYFEVTPESGFVFATPGGELEEYRYHKF